MSIANRLGSLAKNLTHRDRVERDLDQEVRGYVDTLTDDKVRNGLDHPEAHRQAMIELGGVEQVKESVREARAGHLLENLWQDLRYGARTIARNPGWALIAVLSLGLGIGANTAMFSIVNSVLLKPLPYPRPDRLVRITDYFPKGALHFLQLETRSVEIAGYLSGSEFNLTGQGEPIHLTGSKVSANFFKVLGVSPSIGRTFADDEDVPGRNRIVLLGTSLWRSKFGGDPGILGRVITLDGIDREVVGVMPSSFGFPDHESQIWIPLDMDSRDATDYWGKGFMPLIARLQPRATIAQAQNELHGVIHRSLPEFPYPMAQNWNADSTVLPLQQDMVRHVRQKLLLLLSAVLFVLLIACANVAGLLLSRSVARGKEIALRASLGASRGRIIRQLLTESVTLAVAGGALGLALAFIFLRVLTSALSTQSPAIAGIGMDWQALVFVSVLAILSGLLSGLAPALSISRVDLVNAIKTGGQRSQGTASIRMRSYFVAGEVALTVVLVIGAGLLIQSLWRLTLVDPGFRAERVLTVRVSPQASFANSRRSAVAFYDELVRRARGISGVSEVAAVNGLPLSTQVPAIVVELEGYPSRPAESLAPLPWAGAITPDYFRLMRIPLLAGRAFSEADSLTAPGVVILSASTAKRFWPGENPIGKHIRTVWEKEWRTVVGIVADVRQFDLANSTPAWITGFVYMPYPQAVDLTQQIPVTMNLLLKTNADEERIAGSVRELVRDLNPNIPVSQPRTMQSVVTASTEQPRAIAWLFVSFGVVALILAAIGVYGVVSFSASQRTYEIGLRVALGATRRMVFGLVMGQGLRLVGAGLAAGVAISLIVSRLLKSLLFGVGASDPMTFLAVALLLIATAALAGYIPARRAARIDPLTALRVD